MRRGYGWLRDCLLRQSSSTLVSFLITMSDQVSLAQLNNDPNLDLSSNIYNNFYSEFNSEFNINCSYFTEDSSIVDIKANDSSNIIITLSINIQSYLSKKSEFLNFLDKYSSNNVSPHFINFQETWFSQSTNFDLLSISGYKWYTKSRGGRGGGVATLVRDHFSVVELYPDLSLDHSLELLVLRISFENFTCINVNFYRPPSDKNNLQLDSMNESNCFARFLERLEELLYRLEEFQCPIFLVGDHNLNLFSCTVKTSNSCKFLELLTFYGFLNLTSKATRISQNSHSIIDCVATKNCLNKTLSNQIVVNDLSDHFPLVNSFLTNNLKKPKPPSSFFKRSLNENNINSFREALRLNNWDEVHSQTCVNNAFSLFITKFLELYDLHCPLKEVKLNRKRMPMQTFMNSLLLNCRAFKQRLFRLKKTCNSPESEHRYRQYRNQYNRAVRKSKINNYHSLIRAAGKDSKKIWQTIKSVIGMKSEQNKVEFIEVDGERVSGSTNIADSFNKYFSTIGEKLKPDIPSTNYSFRDFLPPPMASSVFVEPLTPVSVYNIIKNLKPKPSEDIDGISMLLISSIAEGICSPLCSIYNLSIETGKFPDKLTISKTIIIHKSGSLSLLDNFRGVSLIPTLSKPLEKYMYSTIYSFLDRNGFWSERQFGFRPKYSTIHNALDLYNLITESLASGRSCLSIFVDIRKCFDMVDRDILLAKFENSGIRGQVLNWFRSYYERRRQKVFFDGVFSTTLEDIILGILQGSILGVISFLIMINDLVESVPPALADLFADDAQLFLSANNLEQLIELTNACLPKIIGWYNANKLIIHPKKTKVIIYSTPLQRYSPEELAIKSNPQIFIDMNNTNESLPQKISLISTVPNESDKFVKHLGLLIDDRMSFQYHFDSLYNKINRSIFTLKQMRNILNKRHLNLLYNSYIKSHLEYGIILFTRCPLNLINPIVKLQKICVRIIDKTDNFRAHTAPLFKKYRILPFPQLMDYNCLIFMHKVKSGKVPSIFNNKWNFQVDNHSYNTRNRNNFNTLTHNRNFIFNSPLYYLPRKFNQLPIEIKSIDNEKVFSRAVTDHLLNSIVF